jgi:hypothetical protein
MSMLLPLRSRGIVLLSSLGVLVGMLLPAGASAEVCPNEALRTGPSAALPDCRAYEQVTPVEKEGGLFFPVVAGAGPDGTADVTYGNNFTALPGVEDNYGLQGAAYSTVRTETGWVTTPMPLPADEYQSAYPGGHFGVPLLAESLDGRSTMWVERKDSQPENRLDLFVRRQPSGVIEDVGPVAPPDSPNLSAQGTAEESGFQSVGVSDDLTHILFSLNPGTLQRRTGFTFWPYDETIQELQVEGKGLFNETLYEYVGANNTAPLMVGVDNSGKLISRCGTVLGSGSRLGGESRVGGESAMHNAMSADGETVFFTAFACVPQSSPTVNELYARVGNGTPGAHTVAISEPSTADCEACDTSEAVRQLGEFEAGSEDGSKVFFKTTQPLLEGAVGENLYEYDFNAPAGHKVIRVTAGEAPVSNPGLEGVAQISEDGSHVYFAASTVLATNPNSQGQAAHAGANNLYVYERDAEYPAGHTNFIADLSNSDSERVWQPTSKRKLPYPHSVDLTPDGRFMVFESVTEHLTADDTSTAQQIFEYDARTGSLARVSIGQNGFNDNGNTDRATSEVYSNIPTAEYNDVREFKPQEYWSHLAVSSDGSYVVFRSFDGLTPQAFDFKPIEGSNYIFAANIYEYHDGNVYLISDGRDVSGAGLSSNVFLAGIDASGKDIFFDTADQLVPQDKDSDFDGYDARIDGGFPAPAAAPECSGDSCQGPLSAAPTLLAPGSEFQAGGGNLAPEASMPATKGATKGKVKKKKTKSKRKARRKAKKAAVRGGRAARESSLGRHGASGRGVR